MHNASGSSDRKLKWLPREQWQRPYPEQQSNPDFSGRAPLTGMFSGEKTALRLILSAELMRRDYARYHGCFVEIANSTTCLNPACECSCDTNHHGYVAMHYAHNAI